MDIDLGKLKEAGGAILKVANTIHNKELFEQLADYIHKVTELTKKNAELEGHILDLKKEIAGLKEKKFIATQVRYLEEAVIVDNPKRPFCKTCWESTKELISLNAIIDGGICPKCDTVVTLSYFGEQTPSGGFAIQDEG